MLTLTACGHRFWILRQLFNCKFKLFCMYSYILKLGQPTEKTEIILQANRNNIHINHDKHYLQSIICEGHALSDVRFA